MQGEKAGSARQLRPLSTALGALLFVAAVEGAHQTQLRAMRRLPAFAQRAVAPAQLGLRVMRAAVWSAAFVLAAAQTRASCQAASDSVCSAAAAAVGSLQLPEWAAMVPLVQRWQQRRLAEQGGQEQPQSPVPQQAQPLRQQQEPGSTLPA